jgi:hypothetical protein
MGDIGQVPFRLRVDMTTLLYLMTCLMSPSPLINLAESRVLDDYQIIRRTNLLIRVRKLICLLSIFCVFAFPTVCCSASTCRS